jgi:hypothetical protein
MALTLTDQDKLTLLGYVPRSGAVRFSREALLV